MLMIVKDKVSNVVNAVMPRFKMAKECPKCEYKTSHRGSPKTRIKFGHDIITSKRVSYMRI